MMRTLFFLILSLLPSAGVMLCRAQAPMDFASARHWCDTTALTGLSGIYVWPDRDAVVLLSPASSSPTDGRYRLTYLEGGDLRIAPGTAMGMLVPVTGTADFRLELYEDGDPSRVRRRKPAVRADAAKGDLRLSDSGIRLSFRPLAFIPGLSRILSVRSDSSLGSRARFMSRIYPLASDGSGAGSRWPRYF